MGTLTIGNVRVSDERTTEFRQQSIKSLIQGNSPFIKDTVIKLTGYYVGQTSFNGKVEKNAPFKLIFQSTVGDITLSMLLRTKIDSEGNDVLPEGTFNAWIRQQVTVEETIENFAKAVLDKVPNGLRVTRKIYNADGRYGVYKASIVGFDIV